MILIYELSDVCIFAKIGLAVAQGIGEIWCKPGVFQEIWKPVCRSVADHEKTEAMSKFRYEFFDAGI